jgi:hypothetical protein
MRIIRADTPLEFRDYSAHDRSRHSLRLQMVAMRDALPCSTDTSARSDTRRDPLMTRLLDADCSDDTLA